MRLIALLTPGMAVIAGIAGSHPAPDAHGGAGLDGRHGRSGPPYEADEIFPWPLLILSVLAGIVITLLGVLVPADRVARTSTATALRSE